MAKDSDPSKWVCPPHTKAKHQMLAKYLDGWYPVLSRWNGRVVFLDGFAGRGRYTDDSEGSPLIALRRLIGHHYFNQMRHREFIFYFIEADPDNATALQREIAQFQQEHAPWPLNVRVHVVNQKFDQTASQLLETLREQKRTLAPTFAFVDPFGYSGLPMDLLAELLDYPRTEVFVNFMVGHVQRFIERDGQENVMRSLFGIDVRDVLAGYDGSRSRVEYLHDVYGQQLKNRANFDYVQSFAMLNATGNVSYYLFHGTRHTRGVRLMKDAMWSVDPGSGHTFSDKLDGIDVLFDLDPDLSPLKAAMCRELAGRTGLSVKGFLEDWTVVNTPFRSTHVRATLRKLEQQGCIDVYRPPGKKQFSDGVTVSFPH